MVAFQKPEEIMTSHTPTYLSMENGDRIAYHHIHGSSPGILFLNGFRSEMSNTKKGAALEKYCESVGRGFIRFDYRGHGLSTGKFLELTVGDWIQDALAVLDFTESGPFILVGSSMGAWIALHVALARPTRVCGICGIAAAPDFTEDLCKNLSPRSYASLPSQGVVHLQCNYSLNPYPISWKLIDGSRPWLILNKKDPIPIKCPVTLIHGQHDKEISWKQSLMLAQALETDDVTITLIKNGDHRLSKPQNVSQLIAVIENMVSKV
jgi:pimeloyl-ACP methyl ester carboxylesterase